MNNFLKEKLLLNAVQLNEIGVLKCLLEKRVNIHHVHQNGNTALHLAYGGKSKIISLLLAAGAKVDVKNSEHQTPLHVAANASDTEMINLLIEAKADINCTDNRGQTPLAICVENSDLNAATCLLRHAAEVNTVNNHGVTPLICAVTKQHEKLVDILIVHKADVNFTDHKQNTALIYAVLNVNKNIVSKLIQSGAEVNIKTLRCYRDANRIKYDLLGVAKNALLDTSMHNLTPLHIAAQTFPRHPAQKSVELVNLLLEGGANVHAVDEDDRTPLHIAAFFGDLDIIQSLIKAGSNINAVDKFGNTPFFLSLFYNHRELAKYLMKSGSDVNLMSESQCSSLYVAVLNNDTELVGLLVKHGALADKGKQSELLLTFKRRNSDVSMLLLKNGADANVKDEIQTPALILCLKLMNCDQIDVIRNFKRSKSSLFVHGRKHAYWYCPDPDYESSLETDPKLFVTVIESMLQYGANVFLTDSEGNTCLHVAARYCSTDILESQGGSK